MTQLKALLAAVADGRTLSQDEAGLGFDVMMSGKATPAQLGAFLMALRVRGGTGDGIPGAARPRRATAVHIKGPRNAVALVGTRKWIEPMARTLGNLGAIRAWVVHGSDGLDELTTTGPSYVAELKDGAVRLFEVTPEDGGLKRSKLDDLKGGLPADNAAAMR